VPQDLDQEPVGRATTKEVSSAPARQSSSPAASVIPPSQTGTDVHESDGRGAAHSRLSERLAQARTALSRLQTYKRLVGTDPLTEDERQIVGEISSMIEQLLD
jgi:hypothetical protein